MSDFAYARLTELDRSFLIYEAGALRAADGSIDLERLLEYTASRLHLIPRYRQRVEPAPLDAHPIWVDDAKFNLRYHLRHSRLPSRCRPRSPSGWW